MMTELEKVSSSIRAKFKIAIFKSGYTQRELADIIGTTPQQLSRAIAGNTTPKDIEIQKRLATFLQIEI